LIAKEANIRFLKEKEDEEAKMKFFLKKEGLAKSDI